jgi:hypothetical protein
MIRIARIIFNARRNKKIPNGFNHSAPALAGEIGLNRESFTNVFNLTGLNSCGTNGDAIAF